VEPGGSTNSRPSAKNGALGTAHGVDTVRFRFREGNDAYLRLRSRPDGCEQGVRGELWWREGAARVGVYPDGLVTVEGRAAALVAGDRGDHSLLEPGRLLLAERAAAGLVAAATRPTLGRVDLAGELRFGDGREGLAFLQALSSIDVPWCKVGIEGRRGDSVETVYARSTNGRSVLWRAYDKGVESDTAAPGERIRWERQIRMRKVREQTVEQFLEGDLRAAFVGRLRRVASIGDVVVADVVGAVERLGELALPPTKRDRLTGYLLWGGRGDYAPRTAQRLRAELRELGVGLDSAQPVRLVVPVGRHLRTLAAMWEDERAAA
jgi:hypothetical protein